MSKNSKCGVLYREVFYCLRHEVPFFRAEARTFDRLVILPTYGVATTMSWKSGSFTEYKNYEIIILNELLLNSRLFIVDIPLFLELLHQPIMAKEKRNRYQVKRPYGESPCCIACGVGTFASAELRIIFEEREEWKQLEGKLAIVSSKEIEGMYFHKEPWLWTSFARASQLSHSIISVFIFFLQPSAVNKRRTNSSVQS